MNDSNVDNNDVVGKEGNNNGTPTDDNGEGNQNNNVSGNNDNDVNDNDNNDGDGDSKKSSEKTFTQKQVSAMMAKEKKQGRNSVYNELGINSKDSKQIAIIKEFLKSQKTDKELEDEQARERAEVAKALEIANTKVEVMKQGIKAQYVDDAVSLIMSQLDDDNDVASVLGSFKPKYPIWFEPNEDDEKNSVGKKGTGSSVKGDKKGSSGNEGESLGMRLAAQRKTKSKKSFYWSK